MSLGCQALHPQSVPCACSDAWMAFLNSSTVEIMLRRRALHVDPGACVSHTWLHDSPLTSPKYQLLSAEAVAAADAKDIMANFIFGDVKRVFNW